MNARNDGLAELLVQLAGNAAALIDKAKAAQAMRAAQTVDGEAVRRDADARAAATGSPPGTSDTQASALQDIIVQQAMRVHALEAEVARLTTALAAAEAEVVDARKARAKPKAKGGADARKGAPAT